MQALRGSLVTLHHEEMFCWSRAINDDTTIAQVFEACKGPEVFRLAYWFDPAIVSLTRVDDGCGWLFIHPPFFRVF